MNYQFVGIDSSQATERQKKLGSCSLTKVVETSSSYLTETKFSEAKRNRKMFSTLKKLQKK